MIPRMTLDIDWSDLAYGLVSSIGPAQPKYRTVEDLWLREQSLAFLSVRSAWDCFLATRDWPQGSEIMISAITIPHMAEIISAWGFVPVPVDVNPDDMSLNLNSIERLSSENTKALLVAHLFGGFIDLAPLAKLCKQRNWALIEDCAQAYNGTAYRGHEGADLSLFSFGTIKSATALGGAMITVRDADLRSALASYRNQQEIHPQSQFAKKVCKSALLKIITTPWCFGLLWSVSCRLGIDFDRLLNASVRGFSGGQFFDRIRRQPPQALLDLLQRRISQDRSAYFAQRGQMVHTLYQHLPKEVSLLGHLGHHHSSWIIPINVPDPNKLTQFLRLHGYDATCQSSSMQVITPHQGYEEAKQAQSSFTEVLYLPIYTPLGSHGYMHLAQIITKYYQKAS